MQAWSGVGEGLPRHPRQRAADADSASRPEAARSSTDEPSPGTTSRFTGVGRDRVDELARLRGVAHARRVDAVGAGSDERLQPGDRLGQRVGMAPQEALGAGRQHDAGTARGRSPPGPPRCAGRRRRGAKSGDAAIAGRVLDRQAADAGARRTDARSSTIPEVVGVAVLEVGVHGQRRGRDDRRHVVEHSSTAIAAVGPRVRPRHPAARRRQRREPGVLEVAGAPGVPRVRQHEAALAVEVTEHLGGTHR